MIAFSKIEEASLSESRKPDSQQDCFFKNRRGTALRISRAKFPIGLLVQKSERQRSPNFKSQIITYLLARKSKRHHSPSFESQISLDKACMQSSHATSALWIPRTTFSKCSDKVKTREACNSHYIAMTKKGKGIALLLVVGETHIYVDLHPPRTGRPTKMLNPSSYMRGHSQRSFSKYSAFFPPNNTSANQPHQSKSISYHQGQKQEYPISCFFFIFSFALALTYKTRRKKTISRNLKSNFRSGTDCPEPLHGCSPSIALEYSSSTVVKVTNPFGKYLRTVDTILAIYIEAAKHG
ncbi:hypothetical protein ACFXTN_025691 [Malus domestica]